MFPRHMLKISITPNWISLIPKALCDRQKDRCENKDRRSNIHEHANYHQDHIHQEKITYLLVEMDIIPLEIAAGIPEYAITKDMAEEAEIRTG